MKKITVIVFLSSLLFISLNFTNQKNVTSSVEGKWSGILTQPNNPKNTIFGYDITLHQEDNTVSGYSTITIIESSYYGKMKLNGVYSDSILYFNESTVIDQNPEPGFRWCIKKGELKYKHYFDCDSLIGTWYADGCKPGKIFLGREN